MGMINSLHIQLHIQLSIHPRIFEIGSLLRKIYEFSLLNLSSFDKIKKYFILDTDFVIGTLFIHH